MRQFIYNHGNGQQDYYLDFDDTTFTIIPVTRHFFSDNKWEGINMSGCLADIMRNDEKNWKNKDLSFSDTGLSKAHLMATTVDLDFVLSELYKGTYHEDLCTACKGYCCSEAKTSGDGMPDNVVCALRVFELPYFPEDSYTWIKDDRGIESYTQSEFVAFLKKNADGKCHFLSDTGCKAPVKPLACAQFSCLNTLLFNSEVKDRVGAQLYAKYSNKGRVGQTEGNKYKEVTTSKVGVNLNVFKKFIAVLKRKNEKTEQERIEEICEKHGCNKVEELEPGVFLVDKMEKKDKEEFRYEKLSLETDPDRIFKMEERDVDIFEEDDPEIPLSDPVTDILLRFPVLRYYPEVNDMLLALCTKSNKDTLLLNVFNYVLIKERGNKC